MISLDIPIIYNGVYSASSVVSGAHKLYPELRRWSLKEVGTKGEIILIDHQLHEEVSIPRYHIALGLGGILQVSTVDGFLSVMQFSDFIRIPNIDTEEDRLSFFNSLPAEKLSSEGNNRIGLELGGHENSRVFFRHKEGIDIRKTTGAKKTPQPRSKDKYTELTEVVEGDILFSYGDKISLHTILDYSPASRFYSVLDKPAVESIDFSSPPHLRDWRQIWPTS